MAKWKPAWLVKKEQAVQNGKFGDLIASLPEAQKEIDKLRGEQKTTKSG